MQVVLILGGGIGKRFGTVLPKQYNLIDGKPVIDYVIEAALQARQTDRIVVVCDPQYSNHSRYMNQGQVEIVPGGAERYDSLQNGLNYIERHYDCQKLCILDAVAPFVYPELIDDYFERLDTADAVITCQKITGSLGNYAFDPLDREDYYITQSPEAFRFPLLLAHFDPHFPSTELAWQLPKDSKKYLNFNFPQNTKITYDFDLEYAARMLPHYQKQRSSDDQLSPGERVLQAVQAHIVDKSAAPNADWLQQLSHLYDKLAKQWGLQSFDVYHISTYGLVLETQSTIYGDVVLKMIPPYTARYPREKAAYQQLAGDYMCPLLATDDDCCALLLRRIAPGKYADFDDNICLTDFFNRVVCTAKETVRHPVFPAYRVDLEAALQRSQTAPFLTGSLEQEVRSALALYDTQFKNSKTYLLHGDLHHYNLLRTAEGYRAIDPIGCRRNTVGTAANCKGRNKMKPIPKEDIQSLERDILFQVLDFFEQYHITYFTSGGTTLGAVRHEGFIPWDDDIDLYIPRADYNRMLQLAANRTIGKNIRIYKPGDKNYIYPFAKACNTNTRLNEQNVRHREQDIGIFIDLFPLDKFYDDPVRRNLLILHSKWLNSLLASASDQVNLSRKGSLRRLAKDTLRTLQKPLAKAIGISRLTRRIDALGRHTAKADCHLVGDLVWCNGGRDFYPAEHFAAGVPGTFEGRTIQNPIGYHSYLQKLYGDYMQLPPEDQRVMHGFTGWYLDETGETV